MRKITLLFLVFASSLVNAQVQSPEEFLGYAIGTQFSRHADVVDYFQHVADNSPMVTYDTYGKTYERRPLTYAIVSTPENLANLEQIRTDNLKSIGIEQGDADPEVAIVWLSYNVHGNEASSTEAAMLTLYKLITEKQAWLENTVVIMDPCINPDGRDRYANWYNQVKRTPYDANPSSVEHNEPWPGGRPNHYLFDLNRDWAWASQIESQQRLKLYNKWMPHIHVDFHEQGYNEPYYFAPAAAPYHEIITDWQYDFQEAIGKNHAKYFDQEGWLFFTRERFDLLYPSYGDTYPTFMGAIGMTYEQAGHGRAGLGVDTDEGFELTLVDRVMHHTTTGLSTVEMGANNAAKLNDEFQKFFNQKNLKYKSFVLTGNQDNIDALTKLLDRHEIAYNYGGGGSASGYQYSTQTFGKLKNTGALVIHTDQPKGKMVHVLFEPDAALEEPLTYDITAWNLVHAYGLDGIASTNKVNGITGEPGDNFVSMNSNAAGYVASWKSMADANFLSEMLQSGIRVRFTEKPMLLNGQSFDRGSLLITKSDNKDNADFPQNLIDLAQKHDRRVYSAMSSYADRIPDFGSPDIKLINPQRVAMMQGDGTSSLSYGALWHFFEQQLHYPITSINSGDFRPAILQNFDVLIMPEGWYGGSLNGNTLDELKSWIRGGGKVIALGRAVNSFSGKDGFGISYNEGEDEDDGGANLTPYAQRERSNVTNLITGAIYKVKMDPTHPMAFGYDDVYYSLKLGSSSFKHLENGFNVGYIDGEAESVAGFSGDDAKASLTNSLVFGEVRMGRGSVVYMVDNPMFRAFWENGKLLLVNSIFMVNSNVFRL